MHLATAAVGFSTMLAPSAARAADEQEAPTGQFSVDCWIGAKFGNQPGELVRGWICVQSRMPEIRADQPPRAQTDPIAKAEVKDVASASADRPSADTNRGFGGDAAPGR
jgi:hypothetical protein